MSVFGSIMSKIFGHHAAAEGSGGAPAAQTDSPATPAEAAPTVTAAAASAAPQPAGAAIPAQNVDVEAVLTDLAGKSGQPLNWRTSIVDLMKLLDLDSSLNARKELAGELNYSGDTNDSAAMNVWLHKQVMQKLSENGGKVPDDLRA